MNFLCGKAHRRSSRSGKMKRPSSLRLLIKPCEPTLLAAVTKYQSSERRLISRMEYQACGYRPLRHNGELRLDFHRFTICKRSSVIINSRAARKGCGDGIIRLTTVLFWELHARVSRSIFVWLSLSLSYRANLAQTNRLPFFTPSRGISDAKTY